MKAPTKAPTRLPTPPRITTISASGSMSASRPGYADMIGPAITPPAPASAAPRQNTVVKRRETGIPTARAMSRSSTPARIMAPKRVRSIRKYNESPTRTAIATTASRYAGNASPAMRTGRCRNAGVGTGIGSPPQTTRQRSAMMKANPSVTSTCESTLPASFLRMNRSSKPPKKATAMPAASAATQRLGTTLSTLTPRYAPSMNRPPCVRFAILIRPKISENPAASRNNSPPNARLLSVWIAQYCRLGLQILGWRVVPGIRRVLQVLLGLVGPELAHVRIGVDHLVHQPSLLARDAPDVDVSDHVAVLVKRYRPAAGVDLGRAHRLHESRLVLDVALDPLERGLEHRGFGVGCRGIEPGVVFPFLAECRGELAVDRIVDLGRIPACSQDAEGLVAHVAQHRLIERGHAAAHLHLPGEALFVELAQVAEAVRAGEAEIDRVGLAVELREVGAIVGHGERREGLLHDLAAELFEHALEPGAHLVAVGDVVGNGHHAAVAERLVAVFGHRVRALRGGRSAAREPGVGLPLRHVVGRRHRERQELRRADVVVGGE